MNQRQQEAPVMSIGERSFGLPQVEMHYVRDTPDPYPWFARALYFIFVGCWFTAVWVVLAYALALTLIGLPLAHWMFDRTNTVMTLQRVG